MREERARVTASCSVAPLGEKSVSRDCPMRARAVEGGRGRGGGGVEHGEGTNARGRGAWERGRGGEGEIHVHVGEYHRWDY